jgi:hypothetical protein
MSNLVKMYIFRLIKSKASKICFAIYVIALIVCTGYSLYEFTKFDISITLDRMYSYTVEMVFIMAICLAVIISYFVMENKKNGFGKNIRSVYSFKKILVAKCVTVAIMAIIFYAVYNLVCVLCVLIYNKGVLKFSDVSNLVIEAQLIKILFLVAMVLVFLTLVELVPGTVIGTFMCLGVSLGVTTLVATAVDEAFFENQEVVIANLLPSAHFYYMVDDKIWDIEYGLDYDKLLNEGKITEDAYKYLAIPDETTMMDTEELTEKYPEYVAILTEDNYYEKYLAYQIALPIHFSAKYILKCLLLVMGYIVVTISVMYAVESKKEVV